MYAQEINAQLSVFTPEQIWKLHGEVARLALKYDIPMYIDNDAKNLIMVSFGTMHFPYRFTVHVWYGHYNLGDVVLESVVAGEVKYYTNTQRNRQLDSAIIDRVEHLTFILERDLKRFIGKLFAQERKENEQTNV